jgi:hypothetical protein
MSSILNRLQILRPLALAAVISCALVSSALACPNCKEGMNSKDPHKTNIAKGYYYSVLWMLAAPSTILTGWGLAIYRAVNKAKRESGSNDSQPLPEAS